MNVIKREDCGVCYSWLINLKSRWCPYVLQKSFYDVGVVLEEFDEDDEYVSGHILDMFPKEAMPYFNQEKDQLIVICIKGS